MHSDKQHSDAHMNGARSGLDTFAHDSLVQLLSTANAMLDNNHVKARECIIRAAALLRGSEAPETRGAVARNRGGLAPWQAKRVIAYISAHLDAKIRVPDLANLVTLSSSHFSRAFHESFGDAPMAYVARQRIRYAQELMLGTHEPLSQIALACGLCDQPHFTRVFRRVVGESPRAWRRQFAPEPIDFDSRLGAACA